MAAAVDAWTTFLTARIDEGRNGPQRDAKVAAAMREVAARYEDWQLTAGVMAQEWGQPTAGMQAGVAVARDAVVTLAAIWDDHPDYPGRQP